MNNEASKKIAEALGVEPIPLPVERDDEEQFPAPVEAKTKLEILRDRPLEEVIIDEDFNEARDNLKELIRKQQEAIDHLTLIAEENENARHYEVLAMMMKNLSEMNDKLLNINKQRKELTKGLPVAKGAQQQFTQPTEQNIKVENAVFVGTTADLDRLLEERRKRREQQQIDVIPTSTVHPKE